RGSTTPSRCCCGKAAARPPSMPASPPFRSRRCDVASDAPPPTLLSPPLQENDCPRGRRWHRLARAFRNEHCKGNFMNRFRHLISRRTSMLLATAALLLPAAHAQTSKGELRIGFQKTASLLVLQKAQGSLEKKLAPLGFGVKWVEFPAGPQLLEGLNVGAVDVGYVGEAPPIFAQAAGARFYYIGFDP